MSYTHINRLLKFAHRHGCLQNNLNLMIYYHNLNLMIFYYNLNLMIYYRNLNFMISYHNLNLMISYHNLNLMIYYHSLHVLDDLLSQVSIDYLLSQSDWTTINKAKFFSAERHLQRIIASLNPIQIINYCYWLLLFLLSSHSILYTLIKNQI